ncbi:Hypothetical protein PHPALM_14791 [Phytophthora palmivora]|uniref:PiggyBac transposable element-derived protein domain-containing protein n=1 Tax=Phytophthora palmivora TaxID=4796 RepID=A0A2P4XTW5_9STRA|nr:Hypothetical protein PHPALM_14791 [Phytophthora palmivora]
MRVDGSVHRGTFGRHMKRDRSKTITRYHHYSSNMSAGAAIKKTFCRGYLVGTRISFDEGAILIRSKFNTMRVDKKDKPHKYGSKCYIAVEVNLGNESNSAMSKGGAQRAVIHNVTKALDGQPRKKFIVTDNFYSSCALALTLLEKGYYYYYVGLVTYTLPRNLGLKVWRVETIEFRMHEKILGWLLLLGWIQSR